MVGDANTDSKWQSVRVSDSVEVIAEADCGVKAMTSESPPGASPIWWGVVVRASGR